MADRGDAQVGRDIRKLAQSRDWTPFEMRAVLALICQGAHLEGSEEFTDRLNQALNPSAEHKREKFSDDIEEKHVRNLLQFLYADKKAAIAFIERQQSGRLTRTASMVFKRSIRYIGTEYEWLVEGRKDLEPRVRAAQNRKCMERMQREGEFSNHWASKAAISEERNKNVHCDNLNAQLERWLEDGEAAPNNRQVLNVRHKGSPLLSIEGSTAAGTPCRPGPSESEGGLARFNPEAANSPRHGSSYIDEWLRDPYATESSRAAPGFEGLQRPPQPTTPRLNTEIGSQSAPETHGMASCNSRNDYSGYLGKPGSAPHFLGEPTSPATSNSQGSPPRREQHDTSTAGGLAGASRIGTPRPPRSLLRITPWTPGSGMGRKDPDDQAKQ